MSSSCLMRDASCDRSASARGFGLERFLVGCPTGDGRAGLSLPMYICMLGCAGALCFVVMSWLLYRGCLAAYAACTFVPFACARRFQTSTCVLVGLPHARDAFKHRPVLVGSPLSIDTFFLYPRARSTGTPHEKSKRKSKKKKKKRKEKPTKRAGSMGMQGNSLALIQGPLANPSRTLTNPPTFRQRERSPQRACAHAAYFSVAHRPCSP